MAQLMTKRFQHENRKHARFSLLETRRKPVFIGAGADEPFSHRLLWGGSPVCCGAPEEATLTDPQPSYKANKTTPAHEGS